MKKILGVRRSGVLLHITSLPQSDLGDDAYRFVDFLHEIGSSIWQTLPLNMPHADGSPYQCLSAHAGHTSFISLKKLVTAGYLTQLDIESGDSKQNLLAKASQRFFLSADSTAQKEYSDFCIDQSFWLEDFSLFITLREQFNHAGWNSWSSEYKLRDKSTLNEAKSKFAEQISVIKFSQYQFFKQWHELKQYANRKGVYLFGDIPIFVAYDSADVWAQPSQFKLDENHEMTVVAGVPPDYFSETGQRWGNPHYNWPVMQADGFQWWLSRMRTQNAMFDLVRIDHFRGLEAAWEIPSTEETAINGTWALAPGDELLAAIKLSLPNVALVAEDLGIITDEVDALRQKYDLPGMKILQFAFGGDDENPYLPENIEKNSVVYTGTHDNDTTLGWYRTLNSQQLEHLYRYLGNNEPDMPFALVNLALSCVSKLAIIPMQDILELGSEDRMNVPGTIDGNWQWRFSWQQLKPQQKQKIASAIQQNKRQ